MKILIDSYDNIKFLVISTVAFGLETKCIGNSTNRFRKMADAIFNQTKWETFKFLFMQSFQEFSKFLGLTQNTKETTDFFMGVVKNSISYREANNVKRNDFLQLLIQLKNSEDGMTMNEVAANACTF